MSLCMRPLGSKGLNTRISITSLWAHRFRKSALELFLHTKSKFYSFFCSLLSFLFSLLKVVLLRISGLEGEAGLSHSDPISHSTTIPRSRRPRISEPVKILFSSFQ